MASASLSVFSFRQIMVIFCEECGVNCIECFFFDTLRRVRGSWLAYACMY